MKRSLIVLSLFATAFTVFGTTDAEARHCRQRRARCCANFTHHAHTGVNYGYQAAGACATGACATGCNAYGAAAQVDPNYQGNTHGHSAPANAPAPPIESAPAPGT